MATTNQNQQRQSIQKPETTTLSLPAPSAAIIAWGYTRDQIELLKRTIAKGTTDDEFSLFMTVANRMKLDPFAKQIYAVKRWDGKEKREVMAIQVGIDGFRAAADRSGKDDGQDGPYWCGADGVWRDVWTEDGPPLAAKVLVYKKGCSRPFIGIARYRSYVQLTRDGIPNSMWSRGDDFMLAKCAEAQALRKAHPDELSGVHIPEEIVVDEDAEDAAAGMRKLPDVAVVQSAPSAAKPANAQQPAKLAEPFKPAMTTEEASEIEALVHEIRTLPELKALYQARIAPREMDQATRERLGKVCGEQDKLIRDAAKADQAQSENGGAS